MEEIIKAQELVSHKLIRVLSSLEEKGFITIKKSKYRTNKICLALDNTEENTRNDNFEVLNQTNQLIEMFRPIAYHKTDDFKKDRRQVKAIEKLVESYGNDNLEMAISSLQLTNSQKYAPVITSPIELEKKWTNLVAFINRKAEDEKSEIDL